MASGSFKPMACLFEYQHWNLRFLRSLLRVGARRRSQSKRGTSEELSLLSVEDPEVGVESHCPDTHEPS